MNPVTNPNQGKQKRLKEYRLLKCWVPTAIPADAGGNDDLPGYRYALQQRVEVETPVYDDKGKLTDDVETKRKWTVVGEGSEAWAKANAEHYNIEVPTDEYIIEDHQEEDD